MDHSHEMQHFSMGIWLVFLAYGVSVVGCVVGLACTRQSAVVSSPRARFGWLAMAAVSIGGIGIWLMHFIAMLGFTVTGSVARYDLLWTVVSALLAIGATLVGLLIIGRKVNIWTLLVGGVVMGIAVNVMHYTGMNAVRIQGAVSYDTTLVAVSVAIAVVAGTLSLWFTLVLQKPMLLLAAGLVMGVAVVGMHYTGMAAMRVTVDPDAPVPAGLEVFGFLFPVFVIGLLALAAPIAALFTLTDDEDDDIESMQLDQPHAASRVS
ncbi:MAG: MHYT domain-containing protein [Rhodococcus fascians]|uniref:MHYT domain-containing protein n=1 Tax=Nocardiaceae TaxID=85025 RepID=UPI00037E3686|nr:MULTISPECIES: MHYT domain-containing protein [Rhodococcus]OZC56804.1 signal protein [Rhodococcus sp. 06-621-2]OZE79471.1 signal protein [Rhodococcus sp. 15-649-1-2]OZF00667.1 signal protein [Rhodococcus sp. 15-1154-1]